MLYREVQIRNAFLLSLIAILLMSTKLTTSGLLKIKVFWNKGYHVIISANGISSEIWSRDSNYILDVVIWPKFGNFGISMREAIELLKIKGAQLSV